jgi:hypothetical protein
MTLVKHHSGGPPGLTPAEVDHIKSRLARARMMRDVAGGLDIPEQMWLERYAQDVPLLLEALESGHEHTFTFLRQEERPIRTWGDRIEEWLVQDVYFCQGCLAEVRKDVRREAPSRLHLGRRDVIWRGEGG